MHTVEKNRNYIFAQKQFEEAEISHPQNAPWGNALKIMGSSKVGKLKAWSSLGKYETANFTQSCQIIPEKGRRYNIGIQKMRKELCILSNRTVNLVEKWKILVLKDLSLKAADGMLFNPSVGARRQNATERSCM